MMTKLSWSEQCCIKIVRNTFFFTVLSTMLGAIMNWCKRPLLGINTGMGPHNFSLEYYRTVQIRVGATRQSCYKH